jgi:F420-non-reducing hydrogenase iron-sulfur subunit
MTIEVKVAENTVFNRTRHAQKITVFCCVKGLAENDTWPDKPESGVTQVKLPCAAMVRDVFLLRAFEAGADGVLVVACAPEKCKRGVGSAYAEKRVARTRKLLDEIGLGGWRLVFTGADRAGESLADIRNQIALHNDTNARETAERLPFVPGDYAALQYRKERRWAKIHSKELGW